MSITFNKSVTTISYNGTLIGIPVYMENGKVSTSLLIPRNLPTQITNIIENEKIILEQLFTSINTKTPEELTPFSSLLGLSQKIDEIKTKLTEKNLEHFLPYMGTQFDPHSYGQDFILIFSLLPNKHLPYISSVFLFDFLKRHQPENSFNKDYIQYKKLEETLKSKQNELSSCKDLDFIKSILSPIKKELSSTKSKCKEIIKEIEDFNATIENYINNIGIKNEYDLISSATTSKQVLHKKTF